jgi:hypothetical protein
MEGSAYSADFGPERYAMILAPWEARLFSLVKEFLVVHALLSGTSSMTHFSSPH